MPSPIHLIDQIQSQLEGINDVRSPHRASAFLIGRSSLEGLGRTPDATEELLVHQGPEGLDIGLYLAPELFQRLRHIQPGGPSGASLAMRELPAFAVVTEGVSHFIYLSTAAAVNRQLSQLELEVQAEVDKFAAAALHLWGRGLRELVSDLCDRLFRSVTFLPHLGSEERDRYEVANRLAGGYARSLVDRFVQSGKLDAFLRELRQSYRLWAGEKLHHLEACAG